jgi:Flp pilus assembly protein TadD
MQVNYQRFDLAEALYNRVLEEVPNNELALNNLATILAEMPGRAGDALQRIDQAIEFHGSRPAFLDTKGSILLLQDRCQEAVECLEQATAVVVPDPRFVFHLAVAYWRTDQKDKARQLLQQALNKDLENQMLTQSDLRWLAELKRELNDS